MGLSRNQEAKQRFEADLAADHAADMLRTKANVEAAKSKPRFPAAADPRLDGVYLDVTVVKDGVADKLSVPLRTLIRSALNEPNRHRFLDGVVRDGLEYLEVAAR